MMSIVFQSNGTNPYSSRYSNNVNFSNLYQPFATETNPLVVVAILMGLLNYLLVIIKIMFRWFSSFTKYLNTYSLSVNAYYIA